MFRLNKVRAFLDSVRLALSEGRTAQLIASPMNSTTSVSRLCRAPHAGMKTGLENRERLSVCLPMWKGA